MIKSLTGFGSVEISDNSNQINIIIRSVNARFLDIKFRGIEIEPTLEMEIRKEIQKSIQRGNVQVQIYSKNGAKNSSSIKFDRERYESVENLIDTIQKEYGRHIVLSDIISLNDLVVGSESIDVSNTILMNGIKDALIQLDDMRVNEGTSITTDIKNRIELIQKFLIDLEKKSVEFVIELKSKYKEKIQSMLDDIKVDEDRLAQEIAINVDRYDFTEEIVRGLSHCDQFNKFMDTNEPIGKKLNFLLQELSREVNTIGSKSSKSYLSNIVVELKSEIEKIREQVQNIL